MPCTRIARPLACLLLALATAALSIAHTWRRSRSPNRRWACAPSSARSGSRCGDLRQAAANRATRDHGGGTAAGACRLRPGATSSTRVSRRWRCCRRLRRRGLPRQRGGADPLLSGARRRWPAEDRACAASHLRIVFDRQRVLLASIIDRLGSKHKTRTCRLSRELEPCAHRANEDYFASAPRPEARADARNGSARRSSVACPASSAASRFHSMPAFRSRQGVLLFRRGSSGTLSASIHRQRRSCAGRRTRKPFRGPKGNLSLAFPRPLPLALIGRVAVALHRQYSGRTGPHTPRQTRMARCCRCAAFGRKLHGRRADDPEHAAVTSLADRVQQRRIPGPRRRHAREGRRHRGFRPHELEAALASCMNITLRDGRGQARHRARRGRRHGDPEPVGARRGRIHLFGALGSSRDRRAARGTDRRARQLPCAEHAVTPDPLRLRGPMTARVRAGSAGSGRVTTGGEYTTKRPVPSRSIGRRPASIDAASDSARHRRLLGDRIHHAPEAAQRASPTRSRTRLFSGMVIGVSTKPGLFSRPDLAKSRPSSAPPAIGEVAQLPPWSCQTVRVLLLLRPS